jgi:GNAT superfamily N-acetyltransferase
VAKKKLVPPTEEFELRPAWRRDDAAIGADAIDFWRRLAILPDKVSPEARASELVAAAYKEGQLIGVTTATLDRLEFLRARLAMLRGAVDPEFRRGRVGFALALYSRDLLERWSYDHPLERVAGLGAIVESPDLIARQREPFWPQTRFGLVGYTKDGRQIRVSWFENFRLD